MKEEFLHYVWSLGLLAEKELIADTGEVIQVIHPGTYNTNQGPDFQNAQVDIDGTRWVGNIEIHKENKQWIQHGHHTDPFYDNTILHVSLNQNEAIFNSKSRRIPSITFQIPEGISER